MFDIFRKKKSVPTTDLAESKYSICYLSQESESLTFEQLEQLLNQTAHNNNELGLSGILIHTLGRFFQIIEGPKKDVVNIYEKIQNDDRHTDFLELYSGSVKEYYFKSYSSTFKILDNSSDIEKVNQYLMKIEGHPYAQKINGFLNSFKISPRLG